MRLGAFGLLADLPQMKVAGYDYAELDLPEIEALDDMAYEKARETAASLALPIEVGSRLFPLTERTFFVEGFRPAEWRGYVERSARRARGLGIRWIVLGNGKARAWAGPGDASREPVFVELVRMIAEIAGENGMGFLLEPLGPKYSNYINRLAEGVRILQKAGLPNAFLMADCRHMVWGGEAFSEMVRCKAYLRHAHVDFPLAFPARPYPDPEDGYRYAGFLDALREAGTAETLTIEADRPKDWKLAHDRAVQALGL